MKSEKSNSLGIILPESSLEQPMRGEIIAIGDGDNLDGENKGMKVKVGDQVIFNKYAGVEMKIEDVTYIILRQIDIIGVIDD